MKKIVAKEAEVFKRQLYLKRALRPITGKSNPPAFIGYESGGVVVSAGVRGTADAVEQILVATRRSGLYLNFFERWKKVSGETYQLSRVYAHLYGMDDARMPEELLAVHYDGEIADSVPGFFYRMGPHMHITASDRRFSGCHIALCLGEQRQICEALQPLSKFFQEALLLIDTEFLDAA